MITTSRLKKTILTLSIISLLQTPLVFGQDSNRSESSVIYSSIVMVGISAMPIILPMTVFDSMADKSDKSLAEEFVYVDAQNEEGEPVKLKLPKEAADKVSINPTDKIKIEVGDKGDRTLYVNGEAKTLFLREGDSHILKQKPLN